MITPTEPTEITKFYIDIGIYEPEDTSDERAGHAADAPENGENADILAWEPNRGLLRLLGLEVL